MTPFRLFRLLGAALLLSAMPAPAQTSYPMVTHVLPGAVQTGVTSEVTVHGRMNFAGASLVHVEGTGVNAELVPPKPAKDKNVPTKPTSVKIMVTVAADATLGPRELRIATAQGISSVGQLVITDHPVAREKGKHGVISDAQPIEIGRMVTGSIGKTEEVDVYRFSVTEGQRVTFAIRSARLMHKVHDLQKHFDPLLSVHDDADRELAANDDYYFADPMLSYLFPKTGEYFVKVRDVRFAGDGRWSYSLLVTDRPYVTALFPMALNPSDPRRVQAVGHGLETSEFVLPVPAEDATPGARTVQLTTPAGPTNPVVVTVTDRPTRVESESNDEPASAELLTLPVVVNGRIERASDIDHFAFDLRKARADADRLPVADGSFDAVVACLVVEHIDDVDAVLAEVARVLEPGGRFVFFLNHPLLQTPGSGWIDDQIIDPPEQYWRVGPYLDEAETVEEVAAGVHIRFVHRPLSRYVNAMSAVGLTLTEMVEPAPPPGIPGSRPRVQTGGQHSPAAPAAWRSAVRSNRPGRRRIPAASRSCPPRTRRRGWCRARRRRRC